MYAYFCENETVLCMQEHVHNKLLSNINCSINAFYLGSASVDEQ